LAADADSLLAQKRYAEAEPAYRLALERAPRDPRLHYSLGIVLWELGRYEEAAAAQLRATTLQPEADEAHYELGNALALLQRYEEAEGAYRRALELRPKFAEAHNGLARVLIELREPEEAAAHARRALAINPAHWPSHAVLGNALRELGRAKEAETAFRRAVALAPPAEVAMPRYNLGTLLLSLGRTDEGWPLYESRLDVAHREWLLAADAPPQLAFPRWNGEPVKGKRVLVWPEQGYGDAIFFARYVAPLAAAGAQVTLAARPPLTALLASVARVVPTDQPISETFDYWTFITSLPARLRDGSIATIPYLTAPAKRVELPARGFRVGLVWKGRPDFRRDRYRSLESFSLLKPLWQVAGVSFFSLQKGVDEDLQAPADQPVVQLGPQIADFADSAAIVAQLDLVITSDTAMAHLAGALGRPVWVLVPSYSTDWRWPRQGAACPWYPGAMRLFHQRQNGDWTETIAEVADALRRAI